MDRRIQGKIKLLIIFACAVIVAVTGLLIYDGWFLDSWDKQTISGDFDGDGNTETIKVASRKLVIEKDDSIIYSSNSEWKVCNCITTDIDDDGIDEILILLWKRGSYDKYTPFWEENDKEYSQHIFIFKLVDNNLKSVWRSSKLVPKIMNWNLIDVNKFYILTEDYEDTEWMYGSWGLVRVK